MAVAIFLDIENLVGGHAKLRPKEALVVIRRFLEETDKLTLAIDSATTVRLAYADWQEPRLHAVRQALVDSGRAYKLMMITKKRGTDVKNLLDIQLALDAAELLFTQNQIEHFIIGSGDGGFYPLQTLLLKYQKKVYFLGRKGSCSSLLRNNDATLIEVDLEPMQATVSPPNTLSTTATAPKTLRGYLSLAWGVLQAEAPTSRASGKPFSVNKVAQKLAAETRGWHAEEFGFSKASQVFVRAARENGWEMTMTASNDQWVLRPATAAANPTQSADEADAMVHSEHGYRRILLRASPLRRAVSRELLDDLLNEERMLRATSPVSRFSLRGNAESERRDQWLQHLVALELAVAGPQCVELREGVRLGDVMEQLRGGARQMLETRLSRVDPDVLDILFPRLVVTVVAAAKRAPWRERVKKLLGRDSGDALARTD